MAHYVAKTLGIRPNEILDTWGVPELLVAYGQYANEEAYKNFLEWKAYNTETKQKPKKPKEFEVEFISPDEMNEEGENNGN